ncbi:hypothetical protein, partial [Salmonella enterica]
SGSASSLFNHHNPTVHFLRLLSGSASSLFNHHNPTVHFLRLLSGSASSLFNHPVRYAEQFSR